MPDGTEERKRYFEEWRERYARMLIEMRADAFDKTDLSVDEIAKRLPWVWGDEVTANRRVTGPERSVEACGEEQQRRLQ
jgi:hypothetical protein